MIAPGNNGYWPEWESYFNDRNGYYTTRHHWCGLGISDMDSGMSAHCMTRMVSNDHSIFSNRCQCSERHISLDALRKERTRKSKLGVKVHHIRIPLANGPLISFNMLKLKSGGPRPNKEGQVCYDVAPTGHRWRHGPGSGKGKGNAQKPRRGGGGAYGTSLVH